MDLNTEWESTITLLEYNKEYFVNMEDFKVKYNNLVQDNYQKKCYNTKSIIDNLKI